MRKLKQTTEPQQQQIGVITLRRRKHIYNVEIYGRLCAVANKPPPPRTNANATPHAACCIQKICEPIESLAAAQLRSGARAFVFVEFLCLCVCNSVCVCVSVCV